VIGLAALVMYRTDIWRMFTSMQQVYAEWYNDNWAYRVKLNISSAKVGGANELFDIGHESGGFSEYTSSSVDGGDLSISTAAALNDSQYGLSALIDDTTTINAIKNITKASSLRLRFYFDPNSVSMATSNRFTINKTYQNGGSYSTIGALSYYNSSGTYKLAVDANDDAGSYPVYAEVSVTDAPHYIEFFATRATTSSSNDGTYTWWVDGVNQGMATGIDNYNLMADYDWQTWLGVEGADVGTSGTIYFDDLTSNTDGTSIGPVLTDFPVYVDLSSMPSNFFSSVNATDAGDLRVTKGDGTTELPREVVYFDKTNRKGELHFKYSGTLPSTTDTSVYIYYGNPGASDYGASATYGKNNVWDNNQKAVWHVSESIGTQYDSTANGHNFTTVTVNSQGASVAKIGRSDYFSGASGQKLSTADSPDWYYSGDFTIDTWVNFTTLPTAGNDKAIYNQWTDVNNLSYLEARYVGSTYIWRVVFRKTAMSTVDLSFTSPGGFVANQWYHVVVKRTGNQFNVYENGVGIGAQTNANPFGDLSGPLLFGTYDGASSDKLDGYLDEIRVAQTARSDTWIYTQYSNQNAPSTFFSTGSEERKRSTILSMSFDEGTGTTVHDSSVNQYTGTLSGSTIPVWQTDDSCVSGKCLSYNGTTAYTSISSSIPNVQTVSFWVRPKTTSETIIDFDGGTHYISASSGVVSATGFSSPTVYVNGVVNGTLAANSWNHIEITAATAFTGSAISIGKKSSTYFTGFIDEFTLYDYVRTATQVQADYAAHSARANTATQLGQHATSGTSLSNGLVGYWKFDEGTGTTGTDASGNGYTATFGAGGTAPTWVPGKYGTGVNFDKVDDYISTTLQPGTWSAKTYSAWVKLQSYQLWGSLMLDASSFNSNTYSGMIQYGGQSVSGYQTGTPLPVKLSTSPAQIYYGQWTYLTVTVDKSAGTVTTFINGEQKSQLKTDMSGFTFTNAGTGLMLGGGTGASTIDGVMDEVRVYNRALSTAEVRQLYTWAPNPVGLWKLDENSGVAANDSSGNGFSGTWVGSGTSHWNPGKYGSAGQFNGTDDRLNIGDISSKLNIDSATPQSFTFEMWEKPEEGITDGGGSALLGGQYARLIFRPLTCSSTDCFGFQLVPGSTISYTKPGTVEYGKWYHVAGVYDKDANLIKIYLNGVLQDSQTPASVDLSAASGMEMYIGYNQFYFKGGLDDVRVYGYARTPSQIVEDMNAGHPAPGSPVGSALGEWTFDEGYGDSAHNTGNAGSSLNEDLAGSSATCPGNASCPTWTPDGKFGKALSFDGSNDYATTADAPALSSLTTLTISAWIYQNTQTGTYDEIVSDFGTGSGDAKWWLGVTNATSQLEFGIQPLNCVMSYSVPGKLSAPVNSILTGRWYHVVGTYDGSTENIYINGTLAATQSYTTGMNTCGGIVQIGTVDVDPNAFFFDGKIDEVKMYTSALSAEQVQLLYTQGKSIVMGSVSDTSGLSGGSVASNSASAAYCVPGDTSPCDAPVGQWKMDENTGTSAYDTSGNGFTGTLTNSPTWGVGKYGSGVVQDGNASYVSVTDNPLLDIGTSSFSAFMWVKLTKTATDDIILYKGAGSSTSIGYNLYSDTSSGGNPTGTGRLVLLISDGSTFIVNALTGTSDIANGAWHYIGFTWDPAIGAKLYIDGVMENSTAATTAVNINNGSSLLLGGYSGASQTIHGTIDQVTLFRYVRTPTQVAWDYNRGAPVGWWKMDENTGILAHDVSEYRNDGTLTNGPVWNQGKFGSSVTLDGIDDSILISGTTVYAQKNAAFSASAWVNLTEFNVNYPTILRLRSDDTEPWFIIFSNQAGLLGLSVGNAGSFVPIKTNTPAATLTGRWHHVAVSYNGLGPGTMANFSLYLDGVLQTNVAGSPYASQSQGSSIGYDHSGNEWKGTIDDVRIYNYALTSSQVRMILNNGAAIRYGP
jgi:hypothetical protein